MHPHPKPDQPATPPMVAFSTTDLARKTGDIVAAALRAPVTLTQHNKPRLVILSVEEYSRLQSAGQTREGGRLQDMPAELADAFRQIANDFIES